MRAEPERTQTGVKLRPMNAESSPPRRTRPEPLTYTVAEAAAALGVSQTTIYRLIARRVLKPLTALRHKRINRQQIQALVEQGHSSSYQA
jgi:excisionase family DNA binding protein